MQKFLHLNQVLLLLLLLALSLCLAGMNNNTRLPSFLSFSLSLAFSLTVPPNIDDALTSSDVIVREGDNVTLRCKAKGSPEPSIKWKRDDNHKIVINKTLEGKFSCHWMPDHLVETISPNATISLCCSERPGGRLSRTGAHLAASYGCLPLHSFEWCSTQRVKAHQSQRGL